jgi:UDP-N-acetylmuramate--alanine ligase
MDNFKDFSELRKLFVKFVENIPFYGAGILCIDHPEVKKISESIVDRRIITYGFSEEAGISCEEVVLSARGAEFTVVFCDEIAEKYNIGPEKRWKDFYLPMFGRHNVQNALAAIAVGLEFNVSIEDMKMSLGSFMGVNRRFTKVADVNGVVVIDDYAHHPVEIASVLNAAKSVCAGKIFVVMQPHRYTRLANFLPDFAKVLELSDEAFIAPVYSAREPFNGIDHMSLLNKIRENGILTASPIKDVKDLCDKIIPQLTSGDFVIFLGAGDITNWAYEFADVLNSLDRENF